MKMRIREIREARGIPHGTCAASLGVSPSVLTNWETETALPRSRDLPLLRDVLGCRYIDELYVEDGEEADDDEAC